MNGPRFMHRIGWSTLLGVWLALWVTGAQAAVARVGFSTAIVATGAQVNSLAINKPAATASGDLMLVQVGIRGGTNVTVTAPAGWSIARSTDVGTTVEQTIFYKFAGAAEPASYTFTFSSAQRVAMGMVVYRGVDTTLPFDGPSSASNTGGTTIAAPAVTTTASNTQVLAFFSTANATVYTSIDYTDGSNITYNELWDAATPSGANGVDIQVTEITPLQAATGTTKSIQATTQNAAAHVGMILALRPASAAAAPGGFNAYETTTAAGAITGVIKTKIAGSNFSVDVIALNAARTAIHTTFTGGVTVQVLNASNNSGALDANNCRSTWTAMLAMAVTFAAADNGRKTITIPAFANVFRDVRVRVNSGSVIGCSNDNFAIRPNVFTNFTITDTDAQTAGTLRTLNNTALPGGVVHKAGRPFTLRATAVNAQATPATTTNYTGTPAVSLTACAGTGCTATFGSLSIGTGAAVSGVINSTTATYSEVGAFNVQLVDSTFAAVDASDGSTAAERNITSGTLGVGRFVPDHFSVDWTAGNLPAFTPRNDIAGCGASAFTYLDETFALSYRIQARAYSASANTDGTTGAVTALYTGSWAQSTVAVSAENGDNATNLNAAGTRLSNVTGSWGTGLNSGSYIVNATNARFNRNAGPDGPFDTVQIGVIVTDPDGPVLENRNINPATSGDCIAAGNCSAVSLRQVANLPPPATAATTGFRFGRLRLSNAFGSERLALPVPGAVQYWNGTGFVTNTADSCTVGALLASHAAFAFGGAGNNLSACETQGTLTAGTAGLFTLTLSAPGTGNHGWTDLTFNLAAAAADDTCTAAVPALATTANMPYLQGNWGGAASYTVNPTARARFGAYKGSDRLIFLRENY